MCETEASPLTKTEGTEITRFNALRHGVLSRYTREVAGSRWPMGRPRWPIGEFTA